LVWGAATARSSNHLRSGGCPTGVLSISEGRKRRIPVGDIDLISASLTIQSNIQELLVLLQADS